MKKTLFIQKIISTLTAITFGSLSGNMASAGVDLSYPGTGVLDRNGDLIPTTNSTSGNTVTISGGGTPTIRHAYGAKSDTNAVTSNTVTISEGGAILQNVYGGWSDKGDATENTVTILGGLISGEGQSGTVASQDVIGGFSKSGKVTGNTVTVSNGKINASITGGEARGSEAVTGNSVTVSNGEIAGGIFGGRNDHGSGIVTGNSVIISGGKISVGPVKGGICGGWANGDATGNTVTISAGEITGPAMGGLTYGGVASGNTVSISGGEITGNVSGGFTYVASTITDNTVSISGGATIIGDVYGGYCSTGVAKGNLVMISGGKITGFIYGGHATSGETTGNTVTISDGKIAAAVYGGRSTSGAVTGNTVKISGGEITKNVFGGYSPGRGVVTGNSVAISGGKITAPVYGGASTRESATGNSVTISDGEITGNVLGGHSDLKSADNTVTISGGKITAPVYGGYSASEEATGNTVAISGGEITGNVYGGFAPKGAATDNTVILNAGASLSATSSIYGGYSRAEGIDFISGNKLVLNDFQGTVTQISNFEFIDITSSGKEGDMLTLAGGVATDLSQSKVNITFTGISRPFNAGDKINLIKNEAGITMGSGTLLQEGQNKVQGTFYIYDVLFGSDKNSIYATVEEKKVNDRSKALAEGRVASMAHLNMGADLIAGQGMAQALDSDKLKGRIHLFSAMAATNSQYDTGSHVDLYGYSALVGASLAPAALPSLNCGVFAESGWGNYGSFSDFEDGAVRGSGSTQYYGGGILTHYDFTKMGIKGLTVEASFRAGKTDADYQSGDLANSQYDLSTPYYGVHTSVDYTRELSAKLKIANYARFFWSHMDGDNTTIEGSDLRFRTMDSQRIKAGSRLFYEIAPDITPYAGLSYEWECSGTSRAVVDGVNGIAAPSLRGGTGTGELGAVWKPMAHQAFWVDFSAQGHVGNRQGVSGVVRLRAEF